MGFHPAYCLDGAARKANLHKPIGLWPCHGQAGNQFWLFSKTGEIRRDEACLDYAGTDVILYPCHGAKGNQYWEYDPETNYVQHGSSKNCLAISEDKKKITVERCTRDNPRVHWKFQKYNAAKKL